MRAAPGTPAVRGRPAGGNEPDSAAVAAPITIVQYPHRVTDNHNNDNSGDPPHERYSG
jgi:hypothetical protein